MGRRGDGGGTLRVPPGEGGYLRRMRGGAGIRMFVVGNCWRYLGISRQFILLKYMLCCVIDKK